MPAIASATPIETDPKPAKTIKEIARAKSAEDHISMAIVVLPYRYEPKSDNAREAVRQWCVRHRKSAETELGASLDKHGYAPTSANLDSAIHEWFWGLLDIVKEMWNQPKQAATSKQVK